jgi:hypothetical protein
MVSEKQKSKSFLNCTGLKNQADIKAILKHIQDNPNEDIDFITSLSFIEYPHIVPARTTKILIHLEKIRKIIIENDRVSLNA